MTMVFQKHLNRLGAINAFLMVTCEGKQMFLSDFLDTVP